MSKFKMCFWPLLTLIILGVALFFNYTASTGLVSDLDVGEVADKYELEISPSSWTFSIWAFIYIWQVLWIVFVLYLTLRYPMKSVILSIPFYIAYNLASIGNGVWIVVWVNEHIIGAGITLFLLAMFLIIASYTAHKYMFVNISKSAKPSGNNYGGVAQDQEDANDEHLLSHKWLTESKSIRTLLYVLVLNGVPFYATWTVIATHLNIGIIICYKGNVEDETVSLLMLSILTAVILMYWYLDFYRLRFYLQFTYSPYIVLIVAFCGILTNGEISGARPTSIFTLVLLIVAILGSIAKVVMGISMRNQPSPGSASFETV